MSVALLKEMFERMVVAKDPTLIPAYYHPDFRMTSNGVEQGYAEFAAGHERVYDTAITYAVRYDEQAWVQAVDRVAGRLWITTSRPGRPATELEIVLVATFRDGLIHRVWEVTWPDWSTLPELEAYEAADDGPNE
jgi:hypothetical protein